MPTGRYTKKVSPAVRKALREQAVKGEIQSPDLARLVAYFFKWAGGERAVAKMLFEEFAGARPGSLVRQRILDMVLRSARYLDEKAQPEDDLGMLNEADLERELMGLIGEASDAEGADEAQGPDSPAEPAEEARREEAAGARHPDPAATATGAGAAEGGVA